VLFVGSDRPRDRSIFSCHSNSKVYHIGKYTVRKPQTPNMEWNKKFLVMLSKVFDTNGSELEVAIMGDIWQLTHFVLKLAKIMERQGCSDWVCNLGER